MLMFFTFSSFGAKPILDTLANKPLVRDHIEFQYIVAERHATRSRICAKMLKIFPD